MRDENTNLTRRQTLRLGGAAGTGMLTVLAGCTGGGGKGGNVTQIGDSGSGGGNNSSNGGSSDSLVTKGRIGKASASNSIDYWTLVDYTINPSSNSKLGTVQKGFFQNWAKKHPNWKINIQLQTNLEQMKTKLLQAVAKGNAPPMSESDSFWVPNFYDNLQPVTGAIKNPDDWYGFVKNIVINNGEWRAVWQETDCRALFYRQDLMDKYNNGNPPKTWDQLVSVGQDIKNKEGMNGFMYNGGKWEATTFDNLAYFWALGGQLLNNSGAPVLDKGKNYDALLTTFKWFKRTIDTGITPQRVVNINDYALLRKAALNNQTAMFLGGSFQVGNIKQQASKKEWKNWKVAKIPQQSTDIGATGTGGWTKVVFTSDKKKQKAAVDLYSRFVTKENMARRCKVGGYLPTRKSVYETNEFFSTDPYFKVFGELLKNGKARPGFPIYITLSEEWQTAAGRVITGQASPKQAVDTMIENVNNQYNR